MPDESSYPTELGRFTLVGRLGLGVSLLAAGTLVGVTVTLGGIAGGDYLEVVNALAATRRNLLPALALGGSVLLLLAGLLTWLVAGWASFRLAGPLYRFARNVHAAREGAGDPIHIRSGDLLQDESQRLLRAIAEVQAHEAALRAAADATVAALDRAGHGDREALRGCIEELRATAGLARV